MNRRKGRLPWIDLAGARHGTPAWPVVTSRPSAAKAAGKAAARCGAVAIHKAVRTREIDGMDQDDVEFELAG
jgi:hypothetical protein